MCNFIRNKEKFCGGFFFTVVGLFFFIILFFLFIYPSIEKNSYEGQTSAFKIEDGSYNVSNNKIIMYRPIYYFNVSNITYECESNETSSLRPDNSSNLVFYDPSNPNDCLTEYEIKSSFYVYFFFFIPLVPIIVGICFMKNGMKCHCCNKNNNNDKYVNIEINNKSHLVAGSEMGTNDFINGSSNHSARAYDNNYYNFA